MIYYTLIFLHSVLRWFVLASLLYAIIISAKAYFQNRHFTTSDNKIRHGTATISHLQLMVGFTLYMQSPLVKYFFTNPKSMQLTDISFFSIIHGSLMLIAITIITIGSALAKREAADRQKFRIILIYYSIALAIILLAIPWPFSPLAQRPYYRLF